MIKKLIQAHPRKFVIGTPIIFLLIANFTGVLDPGNFFYLSAEKKNFSVVGTEVPVMLEISTKTAVNAVGGTLNFSPDTLSVASISRITSVVDLWAEEPLYSNTEGRLHFSGGMLGTKTRSPIQGTIFIVNFNVLKEGKTTITLKDGQILASDGKGTNVISGSKTLTLYARQPGRASPDVNGDGVLSATDVNILYLRTFRAYNPEFDLNGDGKVSWADVTQLMELL